MTIDTPDCRLRARSVRRAYRDHVFVVKLGGEFQGAHAPGVAGQVSLLNSPGSASSWCGGPRPRP
jgi:hypothetical protein